jgi:cell division protein FtsA
MGLGQKVTDAILALDVGTASVKAGVLAEQENEDLDLRGVGTAEQQFGNIQNGSIVDLARVVENVQLAIRQAENTARLHPRKLVIGISGELVKGMTKRLSYPPREHADRRIDSSEIKTILHELQWEAYDMIRRELSEELSVATTDLRLVNASVVGMRVDGEPVMDLRGQSGKVVELDIYNSFAPTIHFGNLQAIAAELPAYHLKGIFVHSFALSHTLLHLKEETDFLMIDVGAGTTDIAVVSGGQLLGTKSFALGGNTFTKRLAYDLGISPHEAETVKLKYSVDEIDKRSVKLVRDVLETDMDTWLMGLQFALQEMNLPRLPEKIYLCGRSSLLPEVNQFLTTTDWFENFPHEVSPKVRHLDFTDFLHSKHDEGLDYLPVFAISYTAYQLLNQNSFMEKALENIIATAR